MQAEKSSPQQQLFMKEIPTAAAGVPSSVQGVGCRLAKDQAEADDRAQQLHKGGMSGLSTCP